MKEIEILPSRLLNDDTVAFFLNKIKDIEGIEEIMMHGPAYREFTERVIHVGLKEIGLKIKVGRFWLVIDDTVEREVVDKLKEICNQTFPYGYTIAPKLFLKTDVSVGDILAGGPQIKRIDLIGAEDLDEEIDPFVEFSSASDTDAKFED